MTTDSLAPMVEALRGPGVEPSVSDRLGPVGVGAQSFPHRLTTAAAVTVEGRSFLFAFHGTLFNVPELTSSAHPTFNAARSLVALYLGEGMAFLRRLRGEFALALWDDGEGTLHLATDRFRVHPLFYYVDGDKLLFGSRIRSVTACPLGLRTSVDPGAIAQVVGASFIATPKTIYREIQKLPPGCALTYREGRVALSQYWDIDFRQPDGAPERIMTGRLKAALGGACQVRLSGDQGHATFGTFLSGGIDSSTVTGLLTQLTGKPIHSFTIGFGEERFNEMSFARIAAKAFASIHHEYYVTPGDVFDAIPRLLDGFDEPFANASAIPTYFCAKVAREAGVEVMYAGDGGDELFGGNERYASQRVFEYYDHVPTWLKRAIVEPTVARLADATNLGLFVKGKKYIQRASIPYPDRLVSYALFRMMPMSDIFSGDFLRTLDAGFDPYSPVAEQYLSAKAHTPLDRQLYLDLKLAIADNDLFKVTRMTEANGVAVRYPFLDHQVAEFAAVLPADLKMKGRQLRSFFKEAYADLLPEEIRAKTKHGFGLPIPVWLKTDRRLNELMHDLLLGAASRNRGIFVPQRVEHLIREHRRDDTSFYGTILWNLMALELWFAKAAKP
jgi:asparagine synthase (glutamine-hydrolysing)